MRTMGVIDFQILCSYLVYQNWSRKNIYQFLKAEHLNNKE